MLTPGELAQMREDQQALMFDSVEIDRKTSEVWDEDAQQYVDAWGAVYAGPARVAVPHGAPIVSPSGELVVPRTALVTIPFGSTPREGDRVTITSPPAGVPEVVWVQAVEAAGIPTACRMACGAL